MKKRTGIRVTILALVLAVAMIMGTMSLTAFADPATTLESSSTFVSKLYYGEQADFSGAVKVVAPNGKETTADLDKYVPWQLGAYTVYLDDNYSYTVSCTMKKAYELRVENDGAAIATYLKAGEKLKIPSAAVWYPSEEYGVDYQKAEAEDNCTVKYKIIGLSTTGVEVSAETQEVTIENPGTYTVHYYCTVGGEENGTKYLYKDYTVKVQQDFADTKAPTLNVVNIPKEISLNTKVTLPKATATDDYDKNVKVNVTVTQYDDATKEYVPVKKVTLDENGYAKEAKDEDETFDNVYNLSFYPTKATKYKVEYSAEDDAGNTTSGVHVYTCEAIDKTAPVLKEINDDLIPTKWAKTVTKKAEGENPAEPTVKLDNTTVTFPYPKFVDNNSKQLTVIFEIKDTVNANTVIRFSNIYDYTKNEDNDEEVAGAGTQYKYDADHASNGLYPNEANFTKDGLTLDFAPYFEKMKEDDKSYTGTYTVSYQARDTYPNISTKTYDITFEETLTDTVAPDVKLTFNDDYLLFTSSEEEFTIPTPTVSDDTDTRPTIEYYLSSAADKTAEEDKNCIKVKGGETAKISLVGEEGAKVPTLVIEDKAAGTKKTLELTDELYYYVKATDDAKNATVLTNEDEPISVVNALGLTKSVKADLDLGDLTVTTLNQGKETSVGGFTFTVPSGENRDLF
ncbi:MAG: hypothetical protein K2M95_04420 [Clostridiales bacterium]|nr:hypothetical protein [Clostridiales bacterium]